MKTLKTKPVLYVSKISWKTAQMLRKAGWTVIIK